MKIKNLISCQRILTPTTEPQYINTPGQRSEQSYLLKLWKYNGDKIIIYYQLQESHTHHRTIVLTHLGNELLHLPSVHSCECQCHYEGMKTECAHCHYIQHYLKGLVDFLVQSRPQSRPQHLMRMREVVIIFIPKIIGLFYN